MRIVLATGIYPPELGGPATYTRELARSLCQRGHVIQVVAYGEQDSSDEKDGFTVHRVSRSGGSVIRYLRYAWRVFRCARQSDLVYAQGPVSEGFPATIAAWVAGRPLLMKVVGDYAWEMAQQKNSKTPLLDPFLEHRHSGLIRVYEWIERWTVKRAQRVITPSNYLANVVERWGVSRSRIDVIRNATPLLHATTDREADRAAFGIQTKTVFLYAGRAVPWKNIGDLISWWKHLPETHVLVIAGNGPEEQRWKDLAHTHGVESRVMFVGSLDRSLLARWYNAADACVLPSGYEGYPNAIAEAAQLGIPCFVSDQAGNPETRETFGELVTVVPYLDEHAWADALARVSPRVSMKSGPSSWTHNQMVNETEQILKQVSGETHGGPMNLIMVSYDRTLCDSSSDTFHRMTDLATDDVSLNVLIVAGTPSVIPVKTGIQSSLSVFTFSGAGLMRIYKAIRQGIREAKRRGAQTIITAQDPFAAGFVGYVISRFTNRPLEIQEHGDFFSGEWQRESFKNRALAILGYFILKRAERIRVVSERIKQHLIQRGVDAKKIDIIPVAHVLPIHSPFSILHSPSRIIVPCRFVPQKGLDTLLDAAEILKQRGVMCEIAIIGDGPLKSWLVREINRRDLRDMVHLEDWKSQDELWKDADLFVLSSRYEGWARTIVEAMAYGVPIVTTDVGCVGSFFRPNLDGRVVQANDSKGLATAIYEQLTEPDRRSAMQKSAYEQAQTFPSQAALHDKQRHGWRALLQLQSSPRWDLWVALLIVSIILSRAASVILFHSSLLNREYGFFYLVQHWFQGYGYSFVKEVGCASAYRSPGYLFFLTALYTFFSPDNTWAQAIIQNIFVMGALWLVYVVGSRLVEKRAALVGAFLMTFYPYTFYHYTQYYHTFLSSFFLLLLVWLLLRLKDTRRMGYAVLAGIGIGALAYVQGTILPAAPIIVMWLLWAWWPDVKRTLAAGIIMAVVSAALIAPWTYRNWTVFHHFIPLTTDKGHALFKANNEIIYELTKRGYAQESVDVETVSSTNPYWKQYRLPAFLEAEFKRDGVYRESVYWTEWHPTEPARLDHCPIGQELNEYEFDSYWNGRARDWMNVHWWPEGAQLQLQKLKTFWQPSLFPSVKTGAQWSFAGSPTKVFLARAGMTAANSLVIFGGVVGILFAFRRRDPDVWLPVIIIIVYSFLHTFFAGYTKYRIPLDNFLAMYAGWVIVMMVHWIRGIHKKSL